MNYTYTWHAPSFSGKEERMGPAFYVEEDCTPVVVRIQAETAPELADAEFNIFDDGVTIFGDRRSSYHDDTTGRDVYIGSENTIALVKGDTDDADAENFKSDLVIERESWLTCNIVTSGKGKNFTVHLVVEVDE